MKHWKYAVSSADEAPSTAPILLCGEVCDCLRRASAIGYDAIEVHTRETAQFDYDEVRRTAAACGCKIGMIITGRLTTEGGVTLVDERPYITDAAVDGMLKYADMAAELEAGIVVGWARGVMPAGKNRRKYIDRLANNLRIIADYAKDKGVPVNLEVINRYESNICTTAEETMTFLEEYELDNVFVHLDTFHMNIDEIDSAAAIRLCRGKLGYVHLAENTRIYPGGAHLDFPAVYEALRDIGYDGYLSIECLPKPDGETAAKRGLAYLKSIE